MGEKSAPPMSCAKETSEADGVSAMTWQATMARPNTSLRTVMFGLEVVWVCSRGKRRHFFLLLDWWWLKKRDQRACRIDKLVGGSKLPPKTYVLFSQEPHPDRKIGFPTNKLRVPG